MHMGITVTEHLLKNQKAHPKATGAFTKLFSAIILSAKMVQRDVAKAGLIDVLGMTGQVNIQGEEVQKLDEIANNTMKKRLIETGELCALASEEEDDIVKLPQGYNSGSYVVHFDPLDGSSNIDANVSIGSIFSIYKKYDHSDDENSCLKNVLQSGEKQVAAGYIIYGSSCILVYSTGFGVHGFTLDPSVGEFLLSHSNIKTPKQGRIYSANEGNYAFWNEAIKSYFDWLKDPQADHGQQYSSRYIGSLVADFHRNLLYGGIFLYPADSKDPGKPNGKLRLMCEANPLAFIIEQAGGLASTGEKRILDIIPNEIHQRVPLIIGSANDVLAYEDFVKGKRNK